MQHAFASARPRIHSEAFIHPDATIIGDVVIGARSSVWPTAVLRGDMGNITVGEESSLQDGVVVHMTEGLTTAVIGNRCTIGHRAIIHGATVGDRCLVGMGAVLLDHVVVGAGSLIAAGSLVTPRTVIPPGSFVRGSPARVVRPVGAREVEMIDVGWKSYLGHTARYRAEPTLSGRMESP